MQQAEFHRVLGERTGDGSGCDTDGEERTGSLDDLAAIELVHCCLDTVTVESISAELFCAFYKQQVNLWTFDKFASSETTFLWAKLDRQTGVLSKVLA